MASQNFDAIYDAVLKSEGGLSTRTAATGDPGGRTMQGITQATYNNWRSGQGLPSQDVARISPDEHRNITRTEYWDKIRGDDLPTGLDYSVFDTAFNAGPGRAVKLLQRSLGMDEDGRIGPDTILAAQGADPSSLLGQFTANRRATYQSFKNADQNPGWWPRINDVSATSASAIKNGGFGNKPVSLGYDPAQFFNEGQDTRPGPGDFLDAGQGNIGDSGRPVETGFGTNFSGLDASGGGGPGYNNLGGATPYGDVGQYAFGGGFNVGGGLGAGPGGFSGFDGPYETGNPYGFSSADASGGVGNGSFGSGIVPNAPVDGFGQNVNVAGGLGAGLGGFGTGITPNGPAQVAALPPQSLADMITSAYQAQLQRAPDATGLQAAYDGISSGQDTFGQFQARLASSPEAQMFRGQGVNAPMLNTGTPVSAQPPQSLTDMITSAYQADLQRAPDAAGLQAAYDGISSGRETFGQFEARMAASPEAQAYRGQGVNAPMLNTATSVGMQAPQSLAEMINATYQAQLQRQGEDVAVRDETDAINSGRDTFEAFRARTQASPEARMLRGESVDAPMLNTAIPVAMQGPETTVGTQGPTSLADMIQSTYQAELQRPGEGQNVQGVLDDINSGRTTFDAFKAKTHDSPEARALRGEPVNAPMLDTATPMLGMSPGGLPTTSLGLLSPSLPDVSSGVPNGSFGLSGITSGSPGSGSYNPFNGGFNPYGFSGANVGGGLGAQPQSMGSLYPAGNSQGGGLDPYGFSQANVGGFDANSFGGGAPVEDFGSGAGLGPTQWNDAPSGGGAQVDAGTAGFNPEASELAYLRGELANQYAANARLADSANAGINFANQGAAQTNQLNAVGAANAARQFAGIQGGLGIAPVPGTSFAPAPVGIQTIGGIGPSNFGMAGLGGAPLRGFF